MVRRLKVLVEADGGSRGNPGVAGYGTVVREAATGEVLLERAGAIGVTTNNVAEYRGLVAGLQAAADLGAVDVEVRMDSKLVVEQMSGRWQIRNPGLRPLAAQAAAIAKRFDTVRYVWVPRERNRRADELANAAMDSAPAGRPVAAMADEALTHDAAAHDAVTGEDPMGSAVRHWQHPAGVVATRLVLVRHGETAMTRERRFSGRADVPLTPVGLAQARAVASQLARLAAGAATVVSSPLARCHATALTLAEALPGARIQDEPDLVECDFGEWDGLSLAEVRAGWPHEYDRWLMSTAQAPPGGESFDEVTSRVRSCVARLLARGKGSRLVVVSHVTPIKLMLRDALAVSGDAFLHRLHLDPGGISVIDTFAGGAVSVRTVNDTSHLADLGR